MTIEQQFLNVQRQIVRRVGDVNSYVPRDLADRAERLEALLPNVRVQQLKDQAFLTA